MLCISTSAKLLTLCVKAFLLNKLCYIGIIVYYGLGSRTSYLSNHYQSITINNFYLSLLPEVSGVPQGPLLGPWPFTVLSLQQ